MADPLASMTLTPIQAGDPLLLGRWKVRGRLGQGGMGVVYLASDGSRLAAVKTVHAHLLADVGMRQRFRREAEAVASVRSPHVAELLDTALDAEPAHLAFRYVVGPTLDEWVRRDGPLTGDVLLAFAAALADAIASIHVAGVTHRDVKPSNIVCAESGPTVIDFGIATLAEATSLTSTGLTVGSVGWMAPEQAEGKRVGPPADVFSWGATVAFAASGVPPFGTGRSDAVIFRILHGEPEIATLPGALNDLVRAALSKDPGSRPTAREVRASLLPPGTDVTVAAEVVTAMVARSWSPPTVLAPAAADSADDGTPRSRWKRTLVGAALVVAAIIGTVAYVAHDDGPPEQVASVGTAEVTTTTAVPKTTTTTTTAAPTTTTAPKTTTTALVQTERIVFQPWAPGGVKDGLTVEREVSGSCWSGSIALSYRSDAWRCSADSEILDPCISSPFGSGDFVICSPGGPWGGVTMLNLSEPLTYEYANSDGPEYPGAPWSVELLDGDRCTFLQGATGAVGDRRINYGCDSGVWILGDLDIGDGVRLYNALIDDQKSSDTRWVQVGRTWN